MSRIPDRAPDLEVTVFGEAATKGSVVAFVPKRKDGSPATRPDGSPMVVKHDDTGKKGKEWLVAVASAVAAAMAEQGMDTIPARVPVVLEMIFYRPRNAGDFGTGRNAGLLKDSAPAFPAVRPDVDKLERAILDGLKGVAWHDDGQVVGAPAWKEYGTPARVELRLWRLPATVAEAQRAVPQAAVCALSAQSPLFASTSGR